MVKKKENHSTVFNHKRRSFLFYAGACAGMSFMLRPVFSAEFLKTSFSKLHQSDWDNAFDAAVSDWGQPVQMGSRVPLFHSETIECTKSAIERYTEIVARGGWPRIFPSSIGLKIGVHNPLVRLLRNRLMISGDLSERAGLSNSFDTYVDAALKRFQNRHGISETGILDADTLSVMNISAHARLQQLEVNLLRIRSEMNGTPLRYVVVNIPAAQVEAVENNVVILRHTAIVGKIDRQTPIMRSKINEIIINPYWNVPRSIIQRDIIPVMRQDPEYLTRNNIHIISSKGKHIPPKEIDWNTEEAAGYRFRQDPGKINAMASVKINFPSPQNVYMHDTPLQSMFDNLMRFDTSGCVRVRNIRDLVTWILKNTKNWNRRRFEETIQTGVNMPVKISDPVHLYFTYISAWSSRRGIVQFRDDIYNRDGVDDLKRADPLEPEWRIGEQ